VARDEEVVVKSTDSHRMVREGDRHEDLLPLFPGAPTYRVRTEWRIESRGRCRECEQHLCQCDPCGCGEPFVGGECQGCGAERDYPIWEPEAKLTVTESRSAKRAWPLRVEMSFGSSDLPSSNDPQTLIWTAELLQEVAAASVERFDLTVDRSGLTEAQVE
jgi:hypothetical protein